jgi:hypothetical protein
VAAWPSFEALSSTSWRARRASTSRGSLTTGEQHLAQGFGLRGFEVMRGRGHRREGDVAKVLEFARQRADGHTEVPFDLARLFGLGGVCGLGPAVPPRGSASSVSDATMTADSTARSMAGAARPNRRAPRHVCR